VAFGWWYGYDCGCYERRRLYSASALAVGDGGVEMSCLVFSFLSKHYNGNRSRCSRHECRVKFNVVKYYINAISSSLFINHDSGITLQYPKMQRIKNKEKRELHAHAIDIEHNKRTKNTQRKNEKGGRFAFCFLLDDRLGGSGPFDDFEGAHDQNQR
jgi:hypothetical protein